jgi:uncharacterized protein YihD (DUF1040 family)
MIMAKYEFKCIDENWMKDNNLNTSCESFNKVFNELGSKGFYMVSSQPDKNIYIFERKMKDTNYSKKINKLRKETIVDNGSGQFVFGFLVNWDTIVSL